MSRAYRSFVVALCALSFSALAIAIAPSAMAEKVDDCVVNLDWPHKSVHNSSRVSSNGVIKCKTRKKYLGVETYLKKSGSGVISYAKDVDNSGRGKYVGAAATKPCISYDYKANAEFLIVEHDGTRHERSHETPWRSVRC